jgi:hypothetical protein
MKPIVDVAIIGAGPYGLSIAAHLAARGVSYRIFGSPMHTWLTQMPRVMRLKSEGFASTLYDPDSAFTLAKYCAQQGIPYADLGLPIPLVTFASYGQEFQRQAGGFPGSNLIELSGAARGWGCRPGPPGDRSGWHKSLSVRPASPRQPPEGIRNSQLCPHHIRSVPRPGSNGDWGRGVSGRCRGRAFSGRGFRSNRGPKPRAEVS